MKEKHISRAANNSRYWDNRELKQGRRRRQRERQKSNRPLPSSKKPHFQNEAKCTSFLVKMSLICLRMKNHFHIKC